MKVRHLVLGAFALGVTGFAPGIWAGLSRPSVTDGLLGLVQGKSVYQRLVAAQENFDKTMARVNDWIVDGIEKGAQSSIITLG